MLTEREHRLRKPIRFSLVSSSLTLLASLFLLSASSPAQTDVTAIIQKSVEANNRDWDADPQFAYTEQDLDGKGVRKTYDVTNVLGTPYEHLIAINGKPLSASQKADEQRKYDRMLSDRKSESAEQRAQRIAKFQADRRRDHAMLDELTKAFDFHVHGEQKLGPYDVYVLNATRRHGYKPPNRDCEVLTGMEGRLWIDKKTFQWVKVEAHVVHPVAIEGFMAQVEPGTRFELEKAPVEGDIWLTTHYSMKASAKVLFLVPHHSQEEDTYSNYHRQTSSPESGKGAEPKPGSQGR
jgi:hypothetical protein